MELASDFVCKAGNQRLPLFATLNPQARQVGEMLNVVENHPQDWPSYLNTVGLQRSGLLEKCHKCAQISMVFSPANDLLWYFQAIKLFDSQVPEHFEVSITDGNAVESVNLLDKFLNAVDIVGHACKLKPVNYAFGCPDELALERSENDCHEFDVAVKDEVTQVGFVCLKVLRTLF